MRGLVWRALRDTAVGVLFVAACALAALVIGKLIAFLFVTGPSWAPWLLWGPLCLAALRLLGSMFTEGRDGGDEPEEDSAGEEVPQESAEQIR